MQEKILIKNGHLIDPANNIDQKMDLLVEGGKIKKVAEKIEDKNAKTIEAKGLIVSPGFIDIHVHLREPGREDKETIHTASRSAAKGGITSVVAMPNTAPVTDNQTVVEYILSKAKKESLVNIFVSGAITQGQTGNKIAEIWEMKNSGIVAVTDDGFDIQNADVYRKAMQYCKTHDMPMISHTEDEDLSCNGHVHEGKVSSKMGIKGIPACSEDVATAKIICLVEDTKHKMHFTHVSTSGSVDQIRLAKSKGLEITADVTPHHFSLTDEAVKNFDTNAKMKPPLRSEDHLNALIEGLKDGTIEVIATDHAPHLWTEKMRQFDDAPFGIVGFETMLPLIITNLVDKNHLTMFEALEKITSNPAKVLNLKKGSLEEGADADICIFDPEKKQKIDKTKLETKGQNTPFHGHTLKGVAIHTIVEGKIVLENEKVIDN